MVKKVKRPPPQNIRFTDEQRAVVESIRSELQKSSPARKVTFSEVVKELLMTHPRYLKAKPK